MLNLTNTSVIVHRHRFSAVAVGVLALLIGGCSTSGGTSMLTPPLIAQRQLPSVQGYGLLFSFGSSVYGLYGAGPDAGLVAVNGVLYGTTNSGGEYGGGTVFSITAGGEQQVLHSFNFANGFSGPEAGLLAVGNVLYGTTVGGGKYGDGTVFSVTTNGTNFHVLHSFGNGVDGSQPMSTLVIKNRVLYGTTYAGGTNGDGSVFRVPLGASKERVLYSFGAGSDGSHPFAGLIFVNGLLYGTTAQGGTAGRGTVFTLTLSGRETILHSFSGDPDGLAPGASLLLAHNVLYGTTYQGGIHNNGGTAFAINTDGTNEHVLYSFGNGSDGANPRAPLIAVNGRLYGTTYAGGSVEGYGTIFRVSTNGEEHILHNFSGNQTDGIAPLSGLVNLKGVLYGTTTSGGISLPSCPTSGDQCDYGTVFALTL